MGFLETVNVRWKIFLAIVFVVLFVNVTVRFGGNTKISYISTNWLSAQSNGKLAYVLDRVWPELYLGREITVTCF